MTKHKRQLQILFNETDSQFVGYINDNFNIIKGYGIAGYIYKKYRDYNLIIDYKNYYLSNAARNMIVLELKNNLIGILNEVCGEDKYYFVKGADFLSTIYSDDIGLRPVGDIDIVVKPERVKMITDYFFQHGFEDFNNYPESYYKIINDRTFRHPKYPTILIELHWNLLSVPETAMIYDSEFLSYNYFIMNDFISAYFLYLLYHAVKHFNRKLYWIVDMVRFLKYYDNPIIFDIIKKYDFENEYVSFRNAFNATGTYIDNIWRRETLYLKRAFRKKKTFQYTRYLVRATLRYLMKK